jgi:hypothetical protein
VLEQRTCGNYIGVRGIESPVYIDNGNRDIPIHDFPTGLRAVVEDRCQKVNPPWSQCQMVSGIGDPEGVSSTHFNSANFELPIGKRTVVSWTSRSHEKGASRRELRSGERFHRGLEIGDLRGKLVTTS